MKKTIKAWATIQENCDPSPTEDIYSTRKQAIRRASLCNALGSRFKVVPCTITIHTKGAADGK